MMCFDFDNKCGTDNDDKLHTAISTLNRYDKRQKKRLSEREILISDENELNALLVDSDKDPVSIIESKELFQEVMKIIETQLTAEERELLISIYLNGETKCAVAERMGLPYRRLRYRVDKILKKVRDIYNNK